MTRRVFSRLLLFPCLAPLAAACGIAAPAQPSSVPTSTAPMITLLSYLQKRRIAATAVSVGTNGAKEIAINGSIDLDFRVNGEIVGIDPRIRDDQKFTPTLDFAAFLVPGDATVSYDT